MIIKLKKKELQKPVQEISKVKERTTQHNFKRIEDFRFCDSYWVKIFEYPIESTN